MLVIRFDFRKLLANRQTLAWIDNESARMTFTKGTSDSPSLRSLARIFHLIETSHPAMIWLERVASLSNPGDAPSRNKFKDIQESLDAVSIACEDQPVVLNLGASQFAVVEPP